MVQGSVGKRDAFERIEERRVGAAAVAAAKAAASPFQTRVKSARRLDPIGEGAMERDAGILPPVRRGGAPG